MTQQAQKRLPDCLDVWSANALKNKVQMLLSSCFTMTQIALTNSTNKKQAYIERIGSECVAEDIPFFLEILAYDEKIAAQVLQNTLK